MKHIVLASASPRRKALLEQIGLKFTVDKRVKESVESEQREPHQLAREISRKKAESVCGYYADALIIAADTIGVIDGRIIGKPCSGSDARSMLALLSGREHAVITGFTVMDTLTRRAVSGSAETIVRMRKITDAEIEAYVKTGEPLDKAGAYGIQGLGAVFIDKIEGEYSNVMGLPLCALTETLKEFGVSAL